MFVTESMKHLLMTTRLVVVLTDRSQETYSILVHVSPLFFNLCWPNYTGIHVIDRTKILMLNSNKSISQ